MRLPTDKGGERDEDQQGRAVLSGGIDSQAGLELRLRQGPFSARGVGDGLQPPAAALDPSPGRATFQAFAGFYDDFTAGYQASAWTGNGNSGIQGT